MLSSLKEKREEGFTLIELLIVIIILGILATVVIFAVGGIQDRGKTNACKTERKNVETALEAFKADNNVDYYPSSLASLTALKNPTDLANRWILTAHGTAAPALTVATVASAPEVIGLAGSQCGVAPFTTP